MTTRTAETFANGSGRWSKAFAAGVVVALLATAGPGNATSVGLPVSDRIGAGDDVVTSATSISRATFDEGGAELVVLGRDDDFPDSLAATALAGSRGPILYTTGGSDANVRTETVAEIIRVLALRDESCDQADDVIIVGGTDAVSDRAAQQIRDAGLCVRRIEGPTRYETARLIAEEVRERDSSSAVLIARADDWADAATGGAYAAQTGTPVIVTDTESLHPEAREFLQASRTTEAVILGGTAAISAATEAEIAALATTRRVAGTTRDLTAVAIAAELWVPEGSPDDQVALVNGYTELGWAYAFATAPFSATNTAPQLYTQTDSLTDSTCRVLEDARPFAWIVGAANIISDEARRLADIAIIDGYCSDYSVGRDSYENGLAMVVDEFDADAAHPVGLYIAREDGTGERFVAAGNFSNPAWHPDRQQIVVVESGSAGAGDRAVLFQLTGRHRTLLELDQGEQLGRVAINPTATAPIELAYEVLMPVPEGVGGEPAIFIETYSEPAGRERVTTSGSALMSDEPYSSNGRLTYFDRGQVIYQDADFTPQVLDSGSDSQPEWGPDGYIAYQTSAGASIRQVGSDAPAELVGPGSFGETDWFRTGNEALDLLMAFNLGIGIDASAIWGDDGEDGASTRGEIPCYCAPGIFPDTSQSNLVVTRSDLGEGVVSVRDEETLFMGRDLDVPASGFAYPSNLFPAP